MRSKEEIEKELGYFIGCLQTAEQQLEDADEDIKRYREKIDIYKWVLEEEEPVKTEGTR